MPSDDLMGYAASSTDFYELLGITSDTPTQAIDSAYRKAAIKYHPDKVGDDPIAKEKLHLLGIGRQLLSEPTTKAIYDNVRAAQLQRQRQNELFEGRRRQMKDDLEARERGVKRPRDEDEGEVEKLEREFRRLAQEGRMKRMEREEALRKELRKHEDEAHSILQPPNTNDSNGDGLGNGKSGVAETDRTVKVRWSADGQGSSVTADRVRRMFTKFGGIESADLLSPKMVRLAGAKKKQLAVTCMILYASVVGAHAAITDFHKQTEPQWQIFDSVQWAANKEPDFLSGTPSNSGSGSAPSTPPTKENLPPPGYTKRFSGLSNPSPSLQNSRNSTKKKPSFNFSSATTANTPNGSPFGKGLGPNSPSLEEMTMIRLRKLEQKRLAAEIERQDREADGMKEAAHLQAS